MVRSLALAAALWLGACASPGSPPAPAIPAGFAQLEPDVASFDALAFSFTDPDTWTEFRIVGPYRLLQTSADGIELEGVDPQLRTPAQLLLFMRGEVLWARARIGGREFLTRVN